MGFGKSFEKALEQQKAAAAPAAKPAKPKSAPAQPKPQTSTPAQPATQKVDRQAALREVAKAQASAPAPAQPQTTTTTQAPASPAQARLLTSAYATEPPPEPYVRPEGAMDLQTKAPQWPPVGGTLGATGRAYEALGVVSPAVDPQRVAPARHEAPGPASLSLPPQPPEDTLSLDERSARVFAQPVEAPGYNWLDDPTVVYEHASLPMMERHVRALDAEISATKALRAEAMRLSQISEASRLESYQADLENRRAQAVALSRRLAQQAAASGLNSSKGGTVAMDPRYGGFYTKPLPPAKPFVVPGQEPPPQMFGKPVKPVPLSPGEGNRAASATVADHTPPTGGSSRLYTPPMD